MAMKLRDLLFRLKQPVKRARMAWQDMEVIQRIPAREPPRPQVLVIKLDVVGDYLVFQPYLRALHRALQEKNWGITLLCNSPIAQLAEDLNGDILDNLIAVDARGRFLHDFGYRKQILEQVAATRYEAVYHSTIKRIYYTESLVRVAHAPVKAGVAWQGRFSRPRSESEADSLYTHLYPVADNGLFEFYRQRAFWRQAAGIEASVADFHFLPGKLSAQEMEKPYFCIFPAAGFALREWPLDRFAALIRQVENDTGWVPVLCGGPSDLPLLTRLGELVENVYIKAGPEISLLDALRIIKGARLVVSNESGPVHMAAVGQTPALVLSNGNHYGWWHPYPAELAPLHRYVYPRRLIALSEEERCREYGTVSRIPMTEVMEEDALSIWSDLSCLLR